MSNTPSDLPSDLATHIEPRRTGPKRIQLSRKKGWRKPAGAVIVARPARWGNPYSVTKYGRKWAVELYCRWLLARPELVGAIRRDLRGRDLACWCGPDEICHGDILLEVANARGPPPPSLWPDAELVGR